MSIKLRWLGTACFEIRLSNGEALIIDPYLDDSLTCPIDSNEIERGDVICVTHGHFDHILDVGRLANRLGSTVVCSHVAAQCGSGFHRCRWVFRAGGGEDCLNAAAGHHYEFLDDSHRTFRYPGAGDLQFCAC